MPYDNCNECPNNGKDTCPFRRHDLQTRQNACLFIKLPIRPLPSDADLDKQADKLMEKLVRWGITGGPSDACGERPLCKLLGNTPCPGCPNRPLPSSYFQHMQETEYSYEDFHHIAFAAGTPEQQARHFQDMLVSTAAVCDFRKQDITRCKFFVDGEGKARAEMPI